MGLEMTPLHSLGCVLAALGLRVVGLTVDRDPLLVIRGTSA